MLNQLFKVLQNTRSNISNIFSIFNGNKISIEDLELIEEKLLESDMGYTTTQNILEIIENNNKSNLKNVVRNHLVGLLPKKIDLKEYKNSTIFMVVGVNGTGKTTSAAKLANLYKNNGLNVTLIAADTYRAAAIDQLKIWADRIDCHLVYNKQTSDPSAILFDGMISAKARDSDIVIIDTAGRLHTYENLLIELKKMYKVSETKFSEFSIQTLITIDANLGQNSIIQAKEFNKYLKINGAILTKLDGTAKGGIIFPLYQELRIPVEYVGFGENIHDIDIFKPKEYVSSLIGIDDLKKKNEKR